MISLQMHRSQVIAFQYINLLSLALGLFHAFSKSPTVAAYLQKLYKNNIDQYQFSIIEKNMEIQSSPFTPVDEASARTLSLKASTMQSTCSLSQFDLTSHTLKLFSSGLTLERPGELPVYLELNFDAKFQVIYQEQKNVKTSKLGIRFYNDSGKQLKVFLEPHAAQLWTRLLGKLMNQKGFHEMFKPIRKLGKGNFATVYEAERVTDKAKFAVKAFSKEACFSAKNGKESLINELAVLRQLNKTSQQNILKLQGVFQSENSIYVIMELLTGKTLFQTIEDRKGKFSHSQTRTLIAGLLKGLKHMHENRIMHRDIKPENIMLRGESLEPVIVDFGLATHADEEQYIFFRCGTPGYVAPEIVNLTKSEHLEPACDIFSLGAVFHVLLCRKALFAGTKYDQVYNNNKQFKINLSGEHFKGVTEPARQLLGKMLLLQPNKRISAKQALNHRYFFEQAEEQYDPKVSSPVLTEVSVSFKDEKRRRGVLC